MISNYLVPVILWTCALSLIASRHVHSFGLSTLDPKRVLRITAWSDHLRTLAEVCGWLALLVSLVAARLG